jgi:coenzyme F420-reducing hydrogenase beta subunit
MDTVKKERKKRETKVGIKIPPKSYQFLEIYSKTINSTPTKIVEGLIEEYLEKDEVKKVLSENEKLNKMRSNLEKKEKEIAELREKIKEQENLQK